MVSAICPIALYFGLRGDGNTPVTLVCEKAHRDVPYDARHGFEPARRAIARVAKEGRRFRNSRGTPSTKRPLSSPDRPGSLCFREQQPVNPLLLLVIAKLATRGRSPVLVLESKVRRPGGARFTC